MSDVFRGSEEMPAAREQAANRCRTRRGATIHPGPDGFAAAA